MRSISLSNCVLFGNLPDFIELESAVCEILLSNSSFYGGITFMSHCSGCSRPFTYTEEVGKGGST